MKIQLIPLTFSSQNLASGYNTSKRIKATTHQTLWHLLIRSQEDDLHAGGAVRVPVGGRRPVVLDAAGDNNMIK